MTSYFGQFAPIQKRNLQKQEYLWILKKFLYPFCLLNFIIIIIIFVSSDTASGGEKSPLLYYKGKTIKRKTLHVRS